MGLERDAGGRVIGSIGDPSLLLLAHEGYGIYRSTNLGQSWNCVGGTCDAWTDTFRDIAFDTQRPDVVWAVVVTPIFGCRIWKSESTGILGSWALAYDCPSECCSAQRISTDRFTGRTFVTYNDAPDRGVFFTDDGGDTWTLGYVPDQSGALALATSPWTPGHLLVGTLQPKVDPISMSTDHGETWENYSVGLPAANLAPLDIEGDAATPGVFYVAFKDHGVWRTQVDGVVSVVEPASLTPALALVSNVAAGGRVTLRFQGARSDATLWISDAAGRRIADLRLGDRTSGEVSWDGRDRGGRSVAAGVYFAVLEVLEARVTSRLVWLGR
jgi:hypothetical protein